MIEISDFYVCVSCAQNKLFISPGSYLTFPIFNEASLLVFGGVLDCPLRSLPSCSDGGWNSVSENCHNGW